MGLRKITECDYYHNSSSPARTRADGYWVWALHGMTHRYYGPATAEYEWYIHGKEVK